MKLDRDMGKDFKMRYMIDAKPKYAKKSIRFADVKFDMCNQMGHTFEIPILRFVWREVERTGNFSTRCPYKAASLNF